MTPTNTSQVVYIAIEQAHSSNSNENEPSLTMIKQQTAQKEYLEKYCTLKINLRLRPCTFSQYVLITYTASVDDLDYVTSFVNIHFPYVIVCIDEENSQTFTSKVSSVSGVTLLVCGEFKQCIQKAYTIGFRQQTFVIARDVRKFFFWNKVRLVTADTLNQKSVIKKNYFKNITHLNY